MNYPDLEEIQPVGVDNEKKSLHSEGSLLRCVNLQRESLDSWLCLCAIPYKLPIPSTTHPQIGRVAGSPAQKALLCSSGFREADLAVRFGKELSHLWARA